MLDLITIDRIEQNKALIPTDFISVADDEKNSTGLHMSEDGNSHYTITLSLNTTTFNPDDITIKLIFTSSTTPHKYIIEDISIRVIDTQGKKYQVKFTDTSINTNNNKNNLKLTNLLVIHNRLSLLGKTNKASDYKQKLNYVQPSYIYTIFNVSLKNKKVTEGLPRKFTQNTKGHYPVAKVAKDHNTTDAYTRTYIQYSITLEPPSIINIEPQLSALVIHHFNAFIYDKLHSNNKTTTP